MTDSRILESCESALFRSPRSIACHHVHFLTSCVSHGIPIDLVGPCGFSIMDITGAMIIICRTLAVPAPASVHVLSSSVGRPLQDL